MWRYSGNPVIPRNLLPDSNSIFNSAVVPFGNGFAGVFRCDDTNIRMTLHAGFSDDGINWRLEPETIKFDCDIPEVREWVYGYDPRVCRIEDRYYVTWCNGYHGPTIGIAWTTDFKVFHQLENAFLPYNRNGVLFPRRINGRFALGQRRILHTFGINDTVIFGVCIRSHFCRIGKTCRIVKFCDKHIATGRNHKIIPVFCREIVYIRIRNFPNTVDFSGCHFHIPICIVICNFYIAGHIKSLFHFTVFNIVKFHCERIFCLYIFYSLRFGRCQSKARGFLKIAVMFYHNRPEN